MHSDSLTLTGTVPAPMDRVFGLLTDAARFPEWLPGCHAVAGSPDVKKGARLEVQFGPRTTAFEITDFVSPTTLGWVEHGARDGSRTFFSLGFAGGSTAVRMKHVWTAPSFGAWLRTRITERRNPRRVLDQTLQNLSKLTTR